MLPGRCIATPSQQTGNPACRLVPVDADGRGRIAQYVRHVHDRFLAAKRLALVAAARQLLVAEAPDEATSVEGAPLPVNPAARSQRQNGMSLLLS